MVRPESHLGESISVDFLLKIEENMSGCLTRMEKMVAI